ncbi:hypothetical protein LPJ57_010937, partial [Coemansia sp. RSA 486]
VGTALSTNGPGYCYVYDDVPAPPAFRPRRSATLAFNAMVNNTQPLVPLAPHSPSPPRHAGNNGFTRPGGTAFYGKEPGSEADSSEEYEPPQPMDISWLKSRNMDIEEAQRMQRLVDNVVAQMNAERKQKSEPPVAGIQ